MPVTCHETDARFARLNDKAIVFDLAQDDCLRELAQDCKLIAVIAVERFEVFGQLNNGEATSVDCHVAVVDILHIGRLDERVIEVLVFRVEWVVYLERAAAFGKIASDVEIPRRIQLNQHRAARPGIVRVIVVDTFVEPGKAAVATSVERVVLHSDAIDTAPEIQHLPGSAAEKLTRSAGYSNIAGGIYGEFGAVAGRIEDGEVAGAQPAASSRGKQCPDASACGGIVNSDASVGHSARASELRHTLILT